MVYSPKSTLPKHEVDHSSAQNIVSATALKKYKLLILKNFFKYEVLKFLKNIRQCFNVFQWYFQVKEAGSQLCQDAGERIPSSIWGHC